MSAGRLEKTEQAETVKLLQALGAAVYVLGTRRPAGRRCPSCATFVAESQGTRQTPGIADLIAFLPGKPRTVLFIEQKRDGGKLSPAQQQFRELCSSSAAAYVTGTLDAVIAWLTTHGYLRASRAASRWQSRGEWET